MKRGNLIISHNLYNFDLIKIMPRILVYDVLIKSFDATVHIVCECESFRDIKESEKIPNYYIERHGNAHVLIREENK